MYVRINLVTDETSFVYQFTFTSIFKYKKLTKPVLELFSIEIRPLYIHTRDRITVYLTNYEINVDLICL
jgi:hypothetical protein